MAPCRHDRLTASPPRRSPRPAHRARRDVVRRVPAAPNSVGTQQIKRQAVTAPKLSKDVRAQLAAAATTGPVGPPGPTGSPGPVGPQGPTSVGVGGINTSVSPASDTNVGSAASVGLAATGKVLVVVTGTFGNACTGAGCGRTLSVQVDGVTVPGALWTVGNTPSEAVAMSGVLTGVADGTHQVQLRSLSSGTVSSPTNDFRIVAIGLG